MTSCPEMKMAPCVTVEATPPPATGDKHRITAKKAHTNDLGMIEPPPD
jgi:hypothetical protein